MLREKTQYKGKNYCYKCSKEIYHTCDICGKNIKQNDHRNYEDGYICGKCFYEYKGWNWNVCDACGKSLDDSTKNEFNCKCYCKSCYQQIKAKDKQVRLEKERISIPALGEIKCPYCGLNFKPKEKRPTSTTGNIARGAVFLP